MTYSLQQAANATGKSKPTIQRAIKSGKMSAMITESGAYQIDPAELHRVYPPVTEQATSSPENELLKQSVPHHTPHETALLRRDLEHAAEKMSLLKDELERERETVNDLRRRLDDTESKRERATAQLTALLTDQRTKADAKPAAIEPPRRRWLFW